MKSATLILMLSAASLCAQLSQGERDYAMSQLHASRKLLLDALAGLTPAQWKFKPAPERWSIQQIAEHIILAEERLFESAHELLKTPAVSGRTVDRAEDEKLYQRTTDRSSKAQAPANEQPKGKFATPAAAAEAFRTSRDRIIRYVETTTDPLRAHVSKQGPDAYQLLLVDAAHTERHVAQINEVKADPRYPR